MLALTSTQRKQRIAQLVAKIPRDIEVKATGGVLGNGVKVGISDNSPMTYTKITQVLEVTVPKIVADRLEKTTHGSGGYKSFMSGLKDVSPTELMLLTDLDPATTASHDKLLLLSKSKNTVWVRIEIPVSRDLATTLFRYIIFQASVSEFSVDTPIGDKQVTNVTLQFEGTDVEIGAAPTASVLG